MFDARAIRFSQWDKRGGLPRLPLWPLCRRQVVRAKIASLAALMLASGLLSLAAAGQGSGAVPTNPTNPTNPTKTGAPSPSAANRPAGTSRKSTATKGKISAGRKPTHAKHSHKRASAMRMKKIARAFVASNELKPMARQLLETRSKAAYAGVEAFAARHPQDDAGAMANLVLGYAHLQDKQYDAASVALARAHQRDAELADYSAYFLAQTYSESQDYAKAQATVKDFAAKYPDSLFHREANVLNARAALELGKPQFAIALLAKYPAEERAGESLLLGRAYLAAGLNDKANAVLRRVYYTMPTSAEADQAGSLLTKSGDVAATVAERKARADGLLHGKRYDQAAREYRFVVTESADAARPAAELALGEALRKAGKYKEARDALEQIPDAASAGLRAQKLYQQMEIARSLDEGPTVLAKDTDLRVNAPGTTSLEEALFSTANYYLLKDDRAAAARYYREVYELFPHGSHGSYAHWKAAWLAYREGKQSEASAQMEEHIQVYGASPETPAALYWRARLAEDESDLLKAHAFLRKLADRYQNYYYGEQARRELDRLQIQGTPQPYAVLQKVPPAPTPPDLSFGEPPPTDSLRLQRAHLLENAGLVEFAVKELNSEAESFAGNWFTLESARLFADSGRYDRSIETMKRALPGYFTYEADAIDRKYWELLFPRPYWDALQKSAGDNGLDAYLVASLIRQESEFYAAAVSKANAIGLMQMLPGTGKQTAHTLGLKNYTPDQLYQPATNLQLGTHYFKSILEHFNGNVEFSLAAYNAGPERVEQWKTSLKFKDAQEFVESIPFTETREYVQAILRNVGVYRRLYGK